MGEGIVVVGSFVYDLVVWVPYFPRQGETLLATQFKMFAGGKGFNQALTARRCGAQVEMVGKVGADPFGTAFLEILEREDVGHAFVVRDETTMTSLGIPMINPEGENAIIGVPRANTQLTTAEVERAQEVIANASLLVLQLEIPLEVSQQAARMARAAGVRVLLNPAPANQPIERLLYDGKDETSLVDWLVLNEIESEMLAGMRVGNPAEAKTAAQALLTKGVRQGVVVTLGKQGALAVTPGGTWQVPAYRVTPVDPTGAGDAFLGAFAVGLAEGMPLEQALSFGNAAGAAAVTVAGAEPSLPRRETVEKMMRADVTG